MTHSKFQAWLSTGRISNIPTVWCNCLVILLLSDNVEFTEAYLGNGTLSILLLAATYIYIGGCFQGDAFDVKFDRKHNPQRPIPSGVLGHKNVLFASIALLVAGIGLTSLTNSSTSFTNSIDYARAFPTRTSTYAATSLVLIITLYSWLHKRSAWFSLSLIALCRFTLILFSSTFLVTVSKNALSGDWLYYLREGSVLWIASTVALYTVCFASVARLEHSSQGISWATLLEIGMLVLPLPCLVRFYYLAPPTQDTPWLSLICFFLYASWIYQAFRALPHSKGQFVSQCLAGFCLLDACFLSTEGLGAVLIAITLFLAANGLQKIASAT